MPFEIRLPMNTLLCPYSISGFYDTVALVNRQATSLGFLEREKDRERGSHAVSDAEENAHRRKASTRLAREYATHNIEE
ncbi:hypothetical protein HPP92_005098 [Vanilla planifolia]|uniref:Uncharacterized protein n=1 Tax=Vanilla planifolia TaxID=51239 RepID=A0A835RM39_VANPL|nr:hypothetical protein HPP92_005098 [Vanilla planifolia]